MGLSSQCEYRVFNGVQYKNDILHVGVLQKAWHFWPKELTVEFLYKLDGVPILHHFASLFSGPCVYFGLH